MCEAIAIIGILCALTVGLIGGAFACKFLYSVAEHDRTGGRYE
jgi:uncharacterized protein YneF (UPF0154 family)